MFVQRNAYTIVRIYISIKMSYSKKLFYICIFYLLLSLKLLTVLFSQITM